MQQVAVQQAEYQVATMRQAHQSATRDPQSTGTLQDSSLLSRSSHDLQLLQTLSLGVQQTTVPVPPPGAVREHKISPRLQATLSHSGYGNDRDVALGLDVYEPKNERRRRAWQSPRGAGVEPRAEHPIREISPRLAATFAESLVSGSSTLRAHSYGRGMGGLVGGGGAPMLPRIASLNPVLRPIAA